MANVLTPRDREKLAGLQKLGERVQHVHGLVERLATQHEGTDAIETAVKRAFVQLKRELSSLGFDTMAQLCGSMEMAARRGGARVSKIRILREGVGSLRQQLDVKQRVVHSEAQNRSSGNAE